MSKVTPSLPKGTRDFGPAELRKRNYIFGIIKSVFEKYGFHPLETPVMENLSTLEGKYGEEGDKLLFRILNSGDFLKDVPQDDLNSRQSSKVTHQISEKGLRYDLTIPFARYVVQHQHEITFPFKRYQIQPVWRADRPQKGRYREFYQCDADVVGSDSLLNEVELILIYDEVFHRLNINVEIKINNRKLIALFNQGLGFNTNALMDFPKFVSLLDEIDKVGLDTTLQKIENLANLSPNMILDLRKILNSNSPEELKNVVSQWGHTYYGFGGALGFQEIEFIFDHLKKLPFKNNIIFDPKLARGLDYYTGTIFEVKANGVQMGSIGGGGRYDNLTGVFGLPGVSGVGISFGVERIYDVMEELKLFDNIDLQSNTTRALFINFGGEAGTKAFQYLQQLRAKDIPAEIYPSNEKMKKQIGYADKKGIPFAIFVGEEELKNNTLQIKNLRTGEQAQRSIEETIELLK